MLSEKKKKKNFQVSSDEVVVKRSLVKISLDIPINMELRHQSFGINNFCKKLKFWNL